MLFPTTSPSSPSRTPPKPRIPPVKSLPLVAELEGDSRRRRRRMKQSLLMAPGRRRRLPRRLAVPAALRTPVRLKSMSRNPLLRMCLRTSATMLARLGARAELPAQRGRRSGPKSRPQRLLALRPSLKAAPMAKRRRLPPRLEALAEDAAGPEVVEAVEAAVRAALLRVVEARRQALQGDEAAAHGPAVPQARRCSAAEQALLQQTLRPRTRTQRRTTLRRLRSCSIARRGAKNTGPRMSTRCPVPRMLVKAARPGPVHRLPPTLDSRGRMGPRRRPRLASCTPTPRTRTALRPTRRTLTRRKRR